MFLLNNFFVFLFCKYTSFYLTPFFLGCVIFNFNFNNNNPLFSIDNETKRNVIQFKYITLLYRVYVCQVIHWIGAKLLILELNKMPLYKSRIILGTPRNDCVSANTSKIYQRMYEERPPILSCWNAKMSIHWIWLSCLHILLNGFWMNPIRVQIRLLYSLKIARYLVYFDFLNFSWIKRIRQYLNAEV